MDSRLKNILDINGLSKEPRELQQICQTLFGKGKHIRARLVALMCDSIGVPNEKSQILCRIIEYIHNSSLLHDDFIDQSDFRRDSKAAWLEFSPSQAVLTGDYLLTQVSLYLVKEGSLDLLKITAESVAALARGEFVQRELKGSYAKDLNKLNEVNELKTSCLFQWCLKAPFIIKNKKDPAFYEVLDSIGYYLGLLFQRADDLLDFGLHNEDSKPVFSDLQEKYYNSFSYYLMKEAPASLEKQYQKCKTLKEVKKIVPHFEETLEKFHKDNEEMIKQTEQEIDKLKNYLDKNEQPLIIELKKCPALFYWRKKT